MPFALASRAVFARDLAASIAAATSNTARGIPGKRCATYAAKIKRLCSRVNRLGGAFGSTPGGNSAVPGNVFFFVKFSSSFFFSFSSPSESSRGLGFIFSDPAFPPSRAATRARRAAFLADAAAADAAARASESAEAAARVRIMGSTSSIVGGCSETLRQNRMRSEKPSPYGLRPTSVFDVFDDTVGPPTLATAPPKGGACAFVTRFRILPSTSLFQSVRSMDAAASKAPRSAFPPPAAPFKSASSATSESTEPRSLSKLALLKCTVAAEARNVSSLQKSGCVNTSRAVGRSFGSGASMDASKCRASKARLVTKPGTFITH